MKTMLRLCIAQQNFSVGDIAGNLKKIKNAIAFAQKNNVNLVVFPELAITGYPPEDLLLKRDFILEQKKGIKSLIPLTNNIVAIVGYIEESKKKLYNSAAIIANKKFLGSYRKKELPNYGVFDEKRYFSPGELDVLWQINNVRVGVNVCEDIWPNNNEAIRQAQKGKCDLLINISSSPYHVEKIKFREKLLKQRARNLKIPIVYTNLIGGQDELVFDGGSMIVNEKGKIVHKSIQFKETLDIIDLELPPLRKNKKQTQFEIKKTTVQTKFNDLHYSPVIHKNGNKWTEIYDALCLGIKDYVEKNKFKEVVLGISGGIDSALVATICTDALGKDKVTGITMPSTYSSKSTLNDSYRLAENLNIELHKIPIEKILNVFVSEFKKNLKSRKIPSIVEENLQARIRGTLLMAYSNMTGALVVATGNKSEISVGYCTLYGDMAGGFSLIKDVPKTWVYELSKYANIKFGWDVIPKTIIKRPPSAELKPNQKDTDSLPPYETLDEIIDLYVEKDKGLNYISGKGLSRDLIKSILLKIDNNEYKRKQGSPGVKITPKSFGKDRRMPITNLYKK